MRLEELIAHCDDAELVSGSGSTRIGDLTEDSRTVLPGSLFVARRGLASDGGRYTEEAIRDGAVAVLTDLSDLRVPEGVALVRVPDARRTLSPLAERFWDWPSSKLKLMGVTGTNGKSSVAHLTHGLLNASGVRCGLIGTIEIDDGRELSRAEMTTPPALEFSRTLATMVEAGCVAAACEVSSHALDQDRTSGVVFDAAVFTNLSGDHANYHETPEHYASAKAKLFEQLGPDALAIANAHDPMSARMLERCPAREVWCGLGEGEASARRDADGWVFSAFGVELRFEPRLVGEFNILNMLQASVCALEFGAEPERIEWALSKVGPPTGRLEPVSSPADDVLVYVDFAHSDDSLARALEALRGAHPERELVCVFGCGGDRDREKRPRMGAVAIEGADGVVITSDNPRTEPPSSIVDEILTGIPKSERARIRVHVERGGENGAIHHAIRDARPGSVVLIAGKGHEHEQILADPSGGVRSVPFDDRSQARAALLARATQSAEA